MVNNWKGLLTLRFSFRDGVYRTPTIGDQYSSFAGVADEIHLAERTSYLRRPIRSGGDDHGAHPSSRCFRADAAFRLRRFAAGRTLGKKVAGSPDRRYRRPEPRAPRPMAMVAFHARENDHRAARPRRSVDSPGHRVRGTGPHIARASRQGMGAIVRMARAGRSVVRPSRLR